MRVVAEFKVDGLRLLMTSEGCPEQYDVYDGETQVAYLRMRHGHFYARCPDVSGETVYEASPAGDGEFTDDERPFYLMEAIRAVKTRNHFQAGRQAGLREAAEVARGFPAKEHGSLDPHRAAEQARDEIAAAILALALAEGGEG